MNVSAWADIIILLEANSFHYQGLINTIASLINSIIIRMT